MHSLTPGAGPSSRKPPPAPIRHWQHRQRRHRRSRKGQILFHKPNSMDRSPAGLVPRPLRLRPPELRHRDFSALLPRRLQALLQGLGPLLQQAHPPPADRIEPPGDHPQTRGYRHEHPRGSRHLRTRELDQRFRKQDAERAWGLGRLSEECEDLDYAYSVRETIEDRPDGRELYRSDVLSHRSD